MIPSTREGQSLAEIHLPTPVNDTSTSIFAALEQRKTTREISAAPLTIQMISNLLWAACGVNRKIGPFGAPGRTAASASNSQEIDIYVAVSEGIYLYNAFDNILTPIIVGDLRVGALTPGQHGIDVKAPIQLIYVVDIHRLTHSAGFQEPGLHDPEIQKSYYFVDTGLIAGNVYLFAAVHGLAAWLHNCDKTLLARQLNLGMEQHVLFAQSVGYPSAEQ